MPAMCPAGSSPALLSISMRVLEQVIDNRQSNSLSMLLMRLWMTQTCLALHPEGCSHVCRHTVMVPDPNLDRTKTQAASQVISSLEGKNVRT